ncbi:MAG: MBOAT family protein [Clostridiales bacterium]|jgi:D-alanyl-lipoteichoic acid acyltransferase DltB (MBOAT superfamily)|nr:MBOAT family protein [Clostridiales bacterium]
MRFHSLAYIIFLPAVALVYWTLPLKAKKYWLLAASYFFYAQWDAGYALLMLVSTAATYAAGLCMASAARFRKPCLILCALFNLGILFFFKYFNFAAEAVSAALSALTGKGIAPPSLNVLLPVGISFYTFQALGYTIDVYRGKIPPEKNFVKYALFVSFFPQLVAGPIERAPNLLRQCGCAGRFSLDSAQGGGFLILWGMFKKLVIADRMAVMADCVFNDIRSYGGLAVAFGAVAFAFQIYCDFSAYSDIARGSARIMGFELMRNFDAPYFSASVREFWRRWHISLSEWFRDYLYYPLGGNRSGGAVWRGKLRTYVNLLIVFFVSGLWHGAGFTFIVWGLLNAVYQIAERIIRDLRKAAPPAGHIRPFRVLTTFCLTCLGWIFFRANSMGDALYAVGALLPARAEASAGLGLGTAGYFLSLGLADAVAAACALAVLLAVDYWRCRRDVLRDILRLGLVPKWILGWALILAVLVFGYYGGGYEPQNFLYFQF